MRDGQTNVGASDAPGGARYFVMSRSAATSLSLG